MSQHNRSLSQPLGIKRYSEKTPEDFNEQTIANAIFSKMPYKVKGLFYDNSELFYDIFCVYLYALDHFTRPAFLLPNDQLTDDFKKQLDLVVQNLIDDVPIIEHKLQGSEESLLDKLLIESKNWPKICPVLDYLIKKYPNLNLLSGSQSKCISVRNYQGRGNEEVILVNPENENNSINILILLVRNPSPNEYVEEIKRKPDELYIPGAETGMTPMQLAFNLGDTKWIETLLKAGDTCADIMKNINDRIINTVSTVKILKGITNKSERLTDKHKKFVTRTINAFGDKLITFYQNLQKTCNTKSNKTIADITRSIARAQANRSRKEASRIATTRSSSSQLGNKNQERIENIKQIIKTYEGMITDSTIPAGMKSDLKEKIEKLKQKLKELQE